MKAVTVAWLLLALAQLCTSLKDPMCGLQPAELFCKMDSLGYTYIPSKNYCTAISGQCLSQTNFFYNKEDCEEKCKE